MASLKELFIDTGLIRNPKAWCFGVDPVVSPLQVAFSAGAKMFSVCATLSFTCPKCKDKNNVFKIVFCAKLHSKIHRRDPSNKSMWYIWQPIGTSGCIVLDSDKFQELTGIDVYQLIKTDDFKTLQQKFQKVIAKGIAAAKPLRDTVVPAERTQYDTYVKSLEEANQIVAEIPNFMEKTYKLVNYDKFTAEIKKRGFGDELRKRADTMTQYHREIGKKFVDKVKRNALKAREQDRAAKQQSSN